VHSFKLDSRKAIEAAALLAAQLPERKISRKRLLALLYIASRECLKASGRPLLGGKLRAMKYGPINGDVYDLISKRESAKGDAEWSQHFHNEEYFVVLDRDPGVNALSRFEVRLLTETFKKHEEHDDWDVALQTHKFYEYRATYHPGSARTIPLEAIIHAVKLGPMASTIARDLKEKEEVDELFENAQKSSETLLPKRRNSEKSAGEN
jgi:uncharacterized phage-associated protein